MKKILLSLIAIAAFSNLALAQTNAALNMVKLGAWKDSSRSVDYNDIWGYAAVGREYAILGNLWGTYFIDITNPESPTLVSKFAGQNTGSTWRDFKVNGHYAYGVADNFNNSLQIFDLQYLPDSVVKVYDSSLLTSSAHNVYIDNNRLYLADNKKSINGSRVRTSMDVFSIENPTSPVLLGTLKGPFAEIHDMFVRNDTAYISAGFYGLFIYDYKDAANPVLISSLTSYISQGYNHSSWLSEDGKTMVFADETYGSPLKVLDLTDIKNPKVVATFQSNPGSIPHNPFIKGNKVYVSYYHDGIQVYDISNPTAPVRTAFYDTYPSNSNYSGWYGAWGVYPYLPSGNIIVGDIDSGLIILKEQDGINTSIKQTEALEAFRVYPNPSAGTFNLRFNPTSKNMSVKVIDLAGRQVYASVLEANATNSILNLEHLTTGMYILQVTDGKSVSSRKINISK